jgi:hypothetical protein
MLSNLPSSVSFLKQNYSRLVEMARKITKNY